MKLLDIIKKYFLAIFLLLSIIILPVVANTTVIYTNDLNASMGTLSGYHITGTIEGKSPFSVNFTDKSFNNPTMWNWSFRDVTGNNTDILFSQYENPNYTFNSAGNFSIKLESGNSDGYNITSMVAFVNVTGSSANTLVSMIYGVIASFSIWIFLGILLLFGMIYYL